MRCHTLDIAKSVVLGLGVILQIIGVSESNSNVFYAGSGICLAACIFFGLLWLIPRKTKKNLISIGFFVSSVSFFVWTIMIPTYPDVMLAATWLTVAILGVTLWHAPLVTSDRALYGSLVSLFFYQMGFTFLAAQIADSAAAVGFLSVGAVGTMICFWYNRWFELTTVLSESFSA